MPTSFVQTGFIVSNLTILIVHNLISELCTKKSTKTLPCLIPKTVLLLNPVTRFFQYLPSLHVAQQQLTVLWLIINQYFGHV